MDQSSRGLFQSLKSEVVRTVKIFGSLILMVTISNLGLSLRFMKEFFQDTRRHHTREISSWVLQNKI